MNSQGGLIRWSLAVAGGLVVTYCVAVLVFVATAPDLRLRFLMVDQSRPAGEATPGIEIIQTEGLFEERIDWRGDRPESGDRLQYVADRPMQDFIQYVHYLWELRSAEVPPGGVILQGADPLASELPKLIQEENGPRWVEIGFYRPSTGKTLRAALPVRSLPWGDVALTLLWFVLELGIFSLGALAFWNRPFDRPAQLFYAMCIVTMGAFVGGYHWWLLAGTFWLNLPFVLCGVLAPVVTLHFFLSYPRGKFPLTVMPRTTVTVMYAVPLVAFVGFLIVDSLVWSQTLDPSPAERAETLAWLMHLKNGIYAYLAIAGLYFLGTLVALISSVVHTRNPVERDQVKFILWAGLIATVFIGYTLGLAYVSRPKFVLGGARFPMFAASLVFMVAYAVSIVRYKLMLIDQIINRGMLYYALSFAATAGLSLTVASVSLAAAYWNTNLSRPQTLLVMMLMMIAVTLMLWVRDNWQQLVDRKFFREKYRLDKALQRMNRAVGQLADPQFLSERMLNSCCDVLQIDRAALYLREGKTASFRLVAAQGMSSDQPRQVTATPEFLQALTQDAALQRISHGTREDLSPVQSTLRDLHAELAHSLEMEDEPVGLVVLGPKQNSTPFTGEDVTFLTALGQITGVALHCAKIHQDLGHLNEELRLKVERIAQQRQQITMLQAELADGMTSNRSDEPGEEFQRGEIRGNSQPLLRVLDTVRKVAVSDTSVLVRGESGTGKELLAQAIHQNSPRRNGPLISVHCAALSAGLLESELFGHVKGAFTGASSDKRGRFELANGGTLFLDEIGDITAETQIKLLRVLQEREFEPVGGSTTIQTDVRVIAATHQNLERLIAEGKFREDLYYRLNVISITLPPLRERRDDLLELATWFLKRAASKGGKKILEFEEDALDALLSYQWPGNIRELENVIERAVVLADDAVIRLTDLPPDVQHQAPADRSRTAGRSQRPALTAAGATRGYLEESTIPADWESAAVSEREALVQSLRQCRGNKAEAARLLGLPRSTYFSKLKKYGLLP